MKNNKLSGYLTMFVSLLISLVSGYCTVVGMGKVFVSAASVTMFIASVIEIGRVILLYDIHHYWNDMNLRQKIPGVMMILIAMVLSALGVFGFMSNAHSQRTQEVIPLEMTIKQKESEIKILNEAIMVNNKQLEQFDSKAFNKYTEMGYVTKAINLQKEQQKTTDKLYNDNREKQEQITKLNQEILQLQLNAEQKSPTLAHLKYYAKLFNVNNDMAIIIFIVLIMTVFDTLAMYLMITSDWILRLNRRKEEDELKPILEKQTYDTLYELINGVNEKIGQIKDENSKFFIEYDSKIENILNKEKTNSSDIITLMDSNTQKINENNIILMDELKDNILSLNDEIKGLRDNILTVNDINKNDYLKIENMIDKSYNNLTSIMTNFKDDSLIAKLAVIEENVKQINNTNLIQQNERAKKSQKNIDIKLNKLVELIKDDICIIETNMFKQYIYDYPYLLGKLKEYFHNDEDIKDKLNNLN